MENESTALRACYDILLTAGFPKDRAAKLTKLIIASIRIAAYSSVSQKGIVPRWTDDEFIALHGATVHRVLINLDPASSVNREIGGSYTLDRLSLWLDHPDAPDALNPLHIANLTELDLNPSVNAEICRETKLRSQQKIEYKYSTQYKCSKCHERKTRYIEVQISRGDEGGSNLVTCIKCGNRWLVHCS